jgi:hypothetical protein
VQQLSGTRPPAKKSPGGLTLLPQLEQKNDLKPWLCKEWCIESVSPEFVWLMEDVLDLYAEPYDPQPPQVCFDESPVQLVSETRRPLSVHPGQPKCYDYEYKRQGT